MAMVTWWSHGEKKIPISLPPNKQLLATKNFHEGPFLQEEQSSSCKEPNDAIFTVSAAQTKLNLSSYFIPKPTCSSISISSWRRTASASCFSRFFTLPSSSCFLRSASWPTKTNVHQGHWTYCVCAHVFFKFQLPLTCRVQDRFNIIPSLKDP